MTTLSTIGWWASAILVGFFCLILILGLRLARVETRLGKVESEVQALRRDLPGIVTAAVREAIGK